MLELILILRFKWVFTLLNHRNVRHAPRVQLLLHFGCRQSVIAVNVELLQTGFQSAAADRIQNQIKLWWVFLPVRRQHFVICNSSVLEAEILGVVAKVCPEVEARSAMDTTPVENYSLCVARRSDDGLQVFRSEVDAAKANFFCGPRCCLRERVDIELRLYSEITASIIID